MTETAPKNCLNCKHWQRQEPTKNVRIVDITVGFCHAEPPKADFKWPRTEALHSCGQWAQEAVVQAPTAPLILGIEDQEPVRMPGPGEIKSVRRRQSSN